MLDGDPELVPAVVVQKFAWESADHFERDEYEFAWRRLGYRVVQELERLPDDKLTAGLRWARWPSWPEAERTALRALITDLIVRVAGDQERWWQLDELIQAAAQLDQDMTPWLRLVDDFQDALVAQLAESYSMYYTHSDGPVLTWMTWDDPGGPIVDWLLSPTLRDRLSGLDDRNAQRALELIDLMVELSIR
ncbi:hypothetical protein DFR72_102509 [Lentzea flaviverrucosa]|uniref:Uncharacterized protein n=1 Tax=Lentzea flaviverrucosa TaxID=200379 RepID=A0A1H9U892_9PSEU|nr:hypothetical protein DFR72_102509 [Lentzea flaviverrucosa]SES05481.1 hypothetical protein SAMN05216195_108348 [Lentzea flaviverrucosa]